MSIVRKTLQKRREKREKNFFQGQKSEISRDIRQSMGGFCNRKFAIEIDFLHKKNRKKIGIFYCIGKKLEKILKIEAENSPINLG